MHVMRTVITAKRLWDGRQRIEDPFVTIEDGRIALIGTRGVSELPVGARVVDFPGATLGPALVDVHTHGGAGHDVMEATPEALGAICGFMGKHGTGGFLATTVTAPLDATLRSLEGLSKWMEKAPDAGQARMMGIHLEGPFLSHAKRGAHPPEYLLRPDIATFDRLFEAAEGRVRLMTLAPELQSAAELAAHATGRGVRVSVGHSNATAKETLAVIGAGATSATHTFNAMRALDHREPGILGTVLTTQDLYAEMICDGIHTAPEMARLWWRAKGPERAILITDAMSAAGMPDGEYQLGGMAVQVSEGRALLPGNVLAGSVLTLDRAVENFIRFTGAGVEEALGLATANPAAMAGLLGVGELAEGGAANLIAVDAEGRLAGSVIGGHVMPV
jgi:N-acetylglucosamine-6-phosphate deacetylase